MKLEIQSQQSGSGDQAGRNFQDKRQNVREHGAFDDGWKKGDFGSLEPQNCHHNGSTIHQRINRVTIVDIQPPFIASQGHMSKGLWISFEGIDGAGKSTHIESLAKTFESQGRTITLTREPGGTELAERLRELLLGSEMDPLSESLLAFAARRDHLNKVILPALTQGHVVLCDRFTDATFAYQGGGRGVPTAVLAQLEHWVQEKTSELGATQEGAGGLWQPDLTLWFDLSPEVAASRVVQARTPDRFESQSLAFFQRVQNAYLQRFEKDPHRFLKIDASLTRHQVWQQVTRGLTAKGWLSIMVPTPAQSSV